MTASSGSNSGGDGRGQPQKFSELEKVEKFSMECLNKLNAEEADLKKLVQDEMKKQEKLQQLRFKYEGKIGVTRDKMEDLRIKELEENIEQLKSLIERTRKSADELGWQAMVRSKEVREEIQRLTANFEIRRIEFQSQKAMKNGTMTKRVQADQYRQKIAAMDAEIASLKAKMERPRDFVNLERLRSFEPSYRVMLQSLNDKVKDLNVRENGPDGPQK